MAKDKDPFDDLFEPFELDDGPPPRGSEPPPPQQGYEEQPQTSAPVEQVPCPSCGAFNPAYNRHCEQCGARLTKEPLPVAPAPMVRATPGGRALSVLAAAVLIVALIALLVNVFRGGGSDEATTTTSSSTTSTVAPSVVQITPTEVNASAQIAATFSDANLIDDNLNTEWQAPHGDGLTIEFRWAQPVRIEYLEIYNIEDQDRFLRNYRIQGYSITFDDLPGVDLRNTLRDQAGGPQRIDVSSIGTTTLTIEILSDYASQAIGGEIAFDEIVVAEVRFFGQEL